MSTILVTGATAGIGKHAVLHLAARGHHVIATGRKEDALARIAKEAAGAKLDTVVLDVNDAKSIEAAHAKVMELTGGKGIDVLVNNAGYGVAGPLEEIGDQELRSQFETNVFGLMAVTRAFLPQMRERRSGRIINVGSVGGRMTMPFFGAYTATKYAVESLSDALRMEMAAFGVSVSLIEPGPIQSEFSERTLKTVTARETSSSPYAKMLARAEVIQAQSDKQAVGPLVVSKAIEHAATSKRPRIRYVVPGRARFVLMVASSLPTRFTDWLMRTFVGLTPKNVPLLQG